MTGSSNALRTGRIAATALLGLLLLLAAAWPAFAQEPLRHPQGLLWRVETPGKPPSHLFGTMHSSDPQIVALPAPVTAALREARSIAIELELGDEVQAKMAGAMVLGGGRRLEGIIGPQRFQALAAIGALYDMQPASLQRLAPWAAMTIISLTPTEFRRIREGHLPLDHAIQVYAGEQGLPLYGLESVEEQIAVFRDVPEPQQVALLDLAIRSHPQIETWYRQMKDAYLTRDLAALARLAQDQSAGADPEVMAAFQSRLIETRNKRMAVRMMERLDEGGAFVAVGALHLPGDLGLVHLLELQGRTLTRIY